MSEEPVVQAHRLARQAEEAQLKGHWLVCINKHTRAFQQYKACIGKTLDPAVNRSLVVIAGSHLQQTRQIRSRLNNQQATSTTNEFKDCQDKVQAALGNSTDFYQTAFHSPLCPSKPPKDLPPQPAAEGCILSPQRAKEHGSDTSCSSLLAFEFPFPFVQQQAKHNPNCNSTLTTTTSSTTSTSTSTSSSSSRGSGR